MINNFAFILLFSITKAKIAAAGISCYQCSSNTSYADCTVKEVEFDCEFPQMHCFTQNSTTEQNGTVFYKGCMSPDQCRRKTESFVECCAVDFCNGVCEDHQDYADGCFEQASRLNYCEHQEKFMRQYCRKSCNFCKGEGEVSLITVTQAQATTESTRKGDFPTQEKPTSGSKATQVTAGPTQQTGEAAKRKSTFDLTIVYYVLSGAAFVLLLCFLVCVLRYRRTYHVKRSGLSQQETDIPLNKSELLSEQTEQTKNEEKCQEQGEDPENDCQLVSVSVLKDIV